ncbi:Putative serine/threonine-protein kinase nek3, partial [Durusdinium trenchii]
MDFGSLTNLTGLTEEEEASQTIKIFDEPFMRSWDAGPDGPKALLDASFAESWNALSFSRSTTKADTGSIDLKKSLEAVGELTVELDQLFEEMGKQSTVLKVGQRAECRLAAGLTRRLEICISGEEVSDIRMACRLDEAWHLPDARDALNSEDDGRLPPEPFSLGLCDTARQALDEGPYREWREPEFYHSVAFTTDSNSFFVNLLAKKDCHVVFISKVIAKTTTSKTKLSNSADSGFGGWMSQDMQKLMTKVRQHKNTKYVERKAARKSARILSRGPGGRVERKKGITFGELVFPEGRPLREQHQIEYAQMKVLQLWLGKRRWMGRACRWDKGAAWAKLSPECPQKLAHKLLRTRQEQSVLTSIAIAGGFAFFLQRQRQLHLMRSRTALRQLAWYKALFAASRFLILSCFLVKGRQQAKTKHSKSITLTPRRNSTARRRSSDAEVFFAEYGPLAMVRKYLKRPKRSNSPVTRSPSRTRSGHEKGTLVRLLELQGFHLHPPEPSLARAAHARGMSRARRQIGAKHLAAKLGRPISSAPKVSSSNARMQMAIQEVSQSTMMMTVSPRELALMA